MPRNSNRSLRSSAWTLSGLIIFSLFISSTCAINNNALLSLISPEQTPTPKQSVTKAQNSEDRTPAYKVGVNVDLVMMYTSVFDRDNRFVNGLKKEDFVVYEDGAKQQITYFMQVDVPVSMGIVLDLSGSMMPKMDPVNRAARAFLEASNPRDQVFLIGFTENVEVLQEFTSDIDEISDAIQNTINMGGTALYDAIYLGVEEARKGNRDKKALIVITDGEDQDSFYELSDVLKQVQESDVQVFNIGFVEKSKKRSIFSKKSIEEKAREALTLISEESGGKAFFPEEVTDIHSIVAEIATELRSQYSIGFFSSNKKRDGTWRRVVIKLNNRSIKKPKIRHRRGYYAPKDSGQ